MAQGQDHPDAQLFPRATGAAEKIVAAHSQQRDLKLYAGWFCPFVQRVWIVLELKGIDYEYKEINPYHKGEELMKLNPRGLVPTLRYAGKPLYESTVICEFLEDTYPNQRVKLFPSDPFEKARARIWIDFVTSRIIPSFHRFLQYQPEPGTGEDQAAQGITKVREEFLDNLKQFTQEMADEEPYFLGKELSMVDVIIAPWAVRLWVFDHFKGGLKIPENGPDAATWARWTTWLNAINALPSIKNTESERSKYLSIYQRYADNTAQSELAKATRSGRGVP